MNNKDAIHASLKNSDYYQAEQFNGEDGRRIGTRTGFDNSPIGIFDSGLGGLTVMKRVSQVLPCESILYLGDTARFPYGPRSLEEVDGFVQQIGSRFVEQGVKLIVIACNSATAAGLKHAQETFDIPIIGVIDPGARAAALATQNRHVGVIATQATVDSGSYTKAMHNIDAGIKVVSAATPEFVEIAEKGLSIPDTNGGGKGVSQEEFNAIACEHLNPLKQQGIDTLVMGCTHFPLIQDMIGNTIGSDIALISSADEVARDVREALSRKGKLAQSDHTPRYEFYTTGDDVEEFKGFGTRVLGSELQQVSRIEL